MFPHHEAEIFQSECCLGHDPVVQYWIHNGMINVDGEKMSKSEGNFWTVRDALESIDPLVLRYTLINAPYRQPVDFNSVMIDDSRLNHGRLLRAYSDGLTMAGIGDWSQNVELSEANERFSLGMNDDFNTRVALVEVQSVVKLLRQMIDSNSDKSSISAATGWLAEFAGEVLGILPSKEEALSMSNSEAEARSAISSQVEALLEARESARESKNWSRADEIRDELISMGVIVEDGADGPTWRIE